MSMADPTEPATKPTHADGMIGCGVIVSAVAVGGLCGFWWAWLFFGLALVAGGVARAVTE